jgi:hypothetical protein
LLRAFTAEPEHLNVVSLDAEPCRRALFQPDGPEIAGGHIHNGLATKANEMMVRRWIRLESGGPMVWADFLNQSVLLEGLQILVDSRQ